MKNDLYIVSDEAIMTKIYELRENKVMLDSDLAQLYNVGTRVLKQAVRRNQERFPADFMFELTNQEFQDLRSHIVTSKAGGTRYMPMAFTEYGVLMLSSVLKNERAVEVNIQIVRIFSKMRKMLRSQQELLERVVAIEKKLEDHNFEITMLFEIVLKILDESQLSNTNQMRPRIGFFRE